MRPMPISTLEFCKRAVIFVAVATLPFLIWYLKDAILLIVGALVIAALLQLGAEPFLRWTPLPRGIALTISGLTIASFIAVVAWLFGAQVGRELADVLQRAGDALTAIQTDLNGSTLGSILLKHMRTENLSVTGIVGPALSISTTVIEAIIVVVISAVYIAAQPNVYRVGLVKLFPPRLHVWADETMADIGGALRLWLLGQLIQMLLIGLMSLIAVWLIGLPSPFALGLIAGVCEFIPYLGPILAGIPAVLVAFTQSPSAALWTILAYIIIHQSEGHLIIPLVQRYLVFIPPAAMLLGLATVTMFFGPFGIIFAAPIVVILFVALRKIYFRDTLGEDTVIPGERTEQG